MSGGRTLARFGWILLLGLALALILPSWPAFDGGRAAAQERVWSLRDFLFPRRQQRVVEPEVQPAPAPAPAKPQRARKPKRVEAAPKPVPPPPAPVAAKAADARVVLVVGDFVASALAEGLDSVFADNPRVRVVDRTRSASGFVRDDHYDWIGQIGGLIDTEKPAAIVILAGANDRQQMKLGDGRAAARSPEWTNEYSARTATFASLVVGAGKPLVWVAAPAFRSPKTTSDMLALNEIFHTSATSAGAEFVDLWDGFVDEKGAFVATGPDINGQPVRLRAGDGVNFTADGKRKLAFYVEKPLRKLLDMPDAAVAAAAPATPDPLVPRLPTDRTPPMMIDDPALDGGVELMGAAGLPPAGPASIPEPLLETARPSASLAVVEGRPGRADDFVWPPRPAEDTGRTASTTQAPAEPAAASAGRLASP